MSITEDVLNQSSLSDGETPELDTAYDAEQAAEALAQSKVAAIRWHRVITLSAIGLCAAVYWVLAGQTAQVESINQVNVRLQSQINQVTHENSSLQMKLSGLTQPSRLLEIAAQLHMHPASVTTISSSRARG